MSDHNPLSGLLSLFKGKKEAPENDDQSTIIPKKQAAIGIVKWAYIVKYLSLAVVISPLVIYLLEKFFGFLGFAVVYIVLVLFALLQFKNAEGTIKYLREKYEV